jgi:hypothetical protein
VRQNKEDLSSFRAETHISLLGGWTVWVGKGKQARKATTGEEMGRKEIAGS